MSFKIQERVPLRGLQLDDTFSPLKRKIKIFGNRLPQDFFSFKNVSNSLEKTAQKVHRNDIQTQNNYRKLMMTERISQTRNLSLRRGNLSSRNKQPQEPNAINLIMGIISSTREIKKSIRKHSMQLKKEGTLIKNINNIENMRLELPPLFLKKGVTNIF